MDHLGTATRQSVFPKSPTCPTLTRSPPRFFNDFLSQPLDENLNGSFLHTMRAFYDGDAYPALGLYFRFFDVAVSHSLTADPKLHNSAGSRGSTTSAEHGVRPLSSQNQAQKWAKWIRSCRQPWQPAYLLDERMVGHPVNQPVQAITCPMAEDSLGPLLPGRGLVQIRFQDGLSGSRPFFVGVLTTRAITYCIVMSWPR